MLQDSSAPPDDQAKPAPASQTQRFRAQRIRERTAAGKPMTPEERRFMEAYEKRPAALMAARRRRNAGRVTPSSAVAAVASVYGIDGDPTAWRVRGAWCHEAWRVLVVVLSRAGEKIDEITRVVGCHRANVPRAARRMEEVALEKPEIGERIVRAYKLAETGGTAMAMPRERHAKLLDAIIKAHRQRRGNRRVVVMEIDVDSPLWKVIDAWQEAYETSGLAEPNALQRTE